MNLLWCKVDVSGLGYQNSSHSDGCTCWDDRSKWEIYNEKIHKHAHSVHNLKVIRMYLAHGNIFENVGFPKEMR